MLFLYGNPYFSTTTVGWGTCNGAKYIGMPFQPQQSKQCEDQCFLIVNGLTVRDNHLVFRVMLYPFHKVGVEGTSASDEHFSFIEMCSGLGYLQGDMLSECAQGFRSVVGLKQWPLEGLEELAP